MIFVGDIALPYKQAIDYSHVPEALKTRNWTGNLEGAVVSVDDNKISGVYNQSDAIEELKSEINIVGFTLANNHIFDTGSFEETISFLGNKNFLYAGIGRNLQEANTELVYEEDNQQIVIVNFGWEAIQCEVTYGDDVGVNPLERSHVLNSVKDLVKKYPKGHIVCYMHWNYELEGEPQPFERELAKKIIDCGASGVIGAHSHRAGGFEMYKDKPIVYSLGNWLFKQNHYFEGKLQFPDFCNFQMAFEWDFALNQIHFHFFEYERVSSSLQYINTEDVTSLTMQELTPFQNLDDREYKRWYKKNHYHKNKGLPIFYWEDSDTKIQLKNRWIRIRDKALKMLLNKGK